MSSYKNNCCGNYGALASAMNGCGWNGVQPAYYNGPCPTAGGDYGWNGPGDDEVRRGARRCGCCGSDRPDRDRVERVQGIFTTPALLNVIAGASIPLICCGSPCRIDTVGGTVQIEEEGVYYAAYTMTPPAGETMTTTLTPSLNGVILPAGIVEVDSAAVRSLSAFSGQVIFRAGSCDRFAITSSEAIAIPAAPTPVLTVDIMRISE